MGIIWQEPTLGLSPLQATEDQTETQDVRPGSQGVQCFPGEPGCWLSVGLGRIYWAGPSPWTQGSLEGAGQSMGAPSKLHLKQQLGAGDQSGRKEKAVELLVCGSGRGGAGGGKRERGQGRGALADSACELAGVTW